MKKFIPYIACGLLLISGWACTRTDDLDVVGVEQGKIVIRTALDPQVETRVVADSAAERKITRIDVVVVDPANNTIVHREVHEKADGLNNFSDDNGNGTLTLKKERNTFVEDKAYNIYLIANASAAIATKIADTTATTTLDDLKRLVQEDYISTTANGVTTFSTLLHLSGTTTPEATAPQTFLMDAVVTQSKGSEVRNIVLYNGVQTENTSVYAEFKRAAAKVIINIKQGSSVEFKRTLELTADQNNGVAITGAAQYEFYNLPTETKVLAEGYDLGRDNNTLIETKLITIPNSGSYPTFVWNDNDVGSVGDDGGEVKVLIVGYADAHEWANASTLNYEPSLLLNLPIMWDEDKDSTTGTNGKETARGGNWYKVPLSQNKVFERNTCYIVNITINALGAESKSEAIELDDIDYDTRPWDVTEIKIGDNSERPKYLKLNTDLVTMYNTNIDTEQLVFSSSSPITSIVLADVYIQNADGTFAKVETDGDGYSAYYLNKYSKNISLTASMFEVSNLSDAVKATAPSGELSGNITIISPLGPNEAELNAAIAKLNKPVHPGEPPVAPEGFVETEPVAPNPEDFVPGIERDESSAKWTVYEGSYGRYREERYVDVKEYRYNSETKKFEYQTGKARDTRYRGSLSGVSDYQEGVSYTWNNDWTEYINIEYNKKYAEYEELKVKYEASINNPEHNAYRETLEPYRALLDAYNSEMEAYNDEVAQLKQTMSDIPETHYNTVRYLEFLVTNEEGLTETFRVEQYPTIYIKNIVGWYSYRDDFYVHDSEPDKPTSYKYKGDRIVGISYNSSSKTYTYNTSSSGFWSSKVNKNANGSLHSTEEGFDIDYYFWNNSDTTTPSGFSDAQDLGNARMYHINVTTTSAKYTVGRPLILDANGNPTDDVENGVTDPSVANSKLVSPSFMTASRLGFVNSGTVENLIGSEALSVVSEHCKNYVEVAADGTEYHNWRLPTASEIQLIIDLQSKTSSDDTVAIDYLLNAGYYYSASGPVRNSKYGSGHNSTISVRCVRDAYKDPTEN